MRQKLFDYFAENHNLTLTAQEMNDIMEMVLNEVRPFSLYDDIDTLDGQLSNIAEGAGCVASAAASAALDNLKIFAGVKIDA